MLPAAFGNSTLEGSALWHDTKEIVAFKVILDRKASTVWIWRHRSGLRRLQPKEIAKALGYHKQVRGSGLFVADIKEWKEDELHVEVEYDTAAANYTVMLVWDASHESLRVIARKEQAFQPLR